MKIDIDARQQCSYILHSYVVGSDSDVFSSCSWCERSRHNEDMPIHSWYPSHPQLVDKDREEVM